MTDVGKLMNDLRADKPEFAEAEAVVDLVRKAGDMLEQMRERKQLTQEQLAKKLDMTPGRISQLESGTLRDAPSLKNLARFAAACGETIDVMASGARVQAGDAAQDEAEATRKEVERLREEIVVLRKQDQSAAILKELTALRQEVGALRNAVRAGRSSPERHYQPINQPMRMMGDPVHIYAAMGEPARPMTHQAGGHQRAMIVMDDLTAVTLHSCGQATESVLAAAGFSSLKVSTVEPVMSGDAIGVMVTMKPQTGERSAG